MPMFKAYELPPPLRAVVLPTTLSSTTPVYTVELYTTLAPAGFTLTAFLIDPDQTFRTAVGKVVCGTSLLPTLAAGNGTVADLVFYRDPLHAFDENAHPVRGVATSVYSTDPNQVWIWMDEPELNARFHRQAAPGAGIIVLTVEIAMQKLHKCIHV